MNTARQFTASFFVCAICFCTAGCGAVIVGGAAAAGTYYYMDGQARATYDTSLDKAFDASLAACKQMGIAVTMQSKKSTSANITGKLSGDTTTIDIKLIGDELTEIIVRIGLWGNEESSRRLQKAIRNRL